MKEKSISYVLKKFKCGLVTIVNKLDGLHDFEHVNVYDATERDDMLN